jgi:hypothetical protein
VLNLLIRPKRIGQIRKKERHRQSVEVDCHAEVIPAGRHGALGQFSFWHRDAAPRNTDLTDATMVGHYTQRRVGARRSGSARLYYVCDALCQYVMRYMLVCRQNPFPFQRRGSPIEDPEEDQPDRSPSHDKVERCRDVPEVFNPTRMYGHQTRLNTDRDGISSLDSGL